MYAILSGNAAFTPPCAHVLNGLTEDGDDGVFLLGKVLSGGDDHILVFLDNRAAVVHGRGALVGLLLVDLACKGVGRWGSVE